MTDVPDDLTQARIDAFLRDRYNEDERVARAARETEALTAFLRARLDEEAAEAQAAEKRTTTTRRIVQGQWVEDTVQPPEWRRSAWTPARVLAEVQAKRAVLGSYLPPDGDPHPGLPCINYEGQDPADYDEYDSCFRHLEVAPRLLRSDYVLRLLALPYADADHPDYDEAWRP